MGIFSRPQLVNPGFLNHQFNSTFKQLGVQQTLLEQNPQDSKDPKLSQLNNPLTSLTNQMVWCSQHKCNNDWSSWISHTQCWKACIAISSLNTVSWVLWYIRYVHWRPFGQTTVVTVHEQQAQSNETDPKRWNIPTNQPNLDRTSTSNLRRTWDRKN